MPTATEYLKNQIATHIHEHHLVVLFDPEKQYSHIIKDLNPPGVSVHTYTDSFIELRSEVAELMTGEKPPDLLLYIPLAEKDTHNALVGFTKAGVTLQPGQHPWQRNTRLSVIARQVLKEYLSDSELSDIENKIDAQQLTLADIDHMVSTIGPPVPEPLTLVFHTRSIHEILLAFISDEKKDEDIRKKGLEKDISELMQTTLGFTPKDGTLEKIRTDLITYLLVSTFICEIGETPSELVKVIHAESRDNQEACRDIIYSWQTRRDIADLYRKYAETIESTLHISTLTIAPDQIQSSRVFPGTEKKLISLAEEACISGTVSDLDISKLSTERLSMFWSEQDPSISFRWKILEEISQFTTLAKDIEKKLREKLWKPQELISAYIEPEHGWYHLDTLHRTILKHQYDDTLDSGWQDDFLDRIIGKVQAQYSTSVDLMTNALTQVLAQEGTRQITIPMQTRIFKTFVEQDNPETKTAYILVDAFRYEMGVSLQEVVRGSTELFAAFGTLPSFTPVGMAALLPDAEKEFEIIVGPNGGLIPVVKEAPVSSREDRIAHLKKNLPGPLAVLKLGDLFPRPKKKIEGQITNSSFILITSQEIDSIGEQVESHVARDVMDEVIRYIRRTISHLTRLGVKRIVITADHGYLFGEELTDAMKIDPPGGKTIALHRRFWAGTGGEARESYIRMRPDSVGIKSSLEFAYPTGIGAFKASGGGTTYHHGGISLQELIIPVLVVENTGQTSECDSSISWSISISDNKISSRMVSVKITGIITSITCDQIPKVRVEIRSGAQTISKPLGAHYEYRDATGDICMRIKKDNANDRTIEDNTAIMQILTIPDSGQATIHLLDSETDVELKKIGPFPVNISF
ncbi:MAG: PglZ domain-containing protein [Methanomicrobiales archaeon]|nr:PglZ domain-containing protein [Methanomicrobiales archaeon]